MASMHGLPSDLITQLIDGIVAGVQAALMLVSAIAAVIGLIRKIVTTFTGTNKVIN
jgi:hypothetical protein